ncbi:MAG: glycosyl hydrolase family 2 [Prevotella sp.]|nr:glycosyl hydrolase family 2 [Prevotella sp.]
MNGTLRKGGFRRFIIFLPFYLFTLLPLSAQQWPEPRPEAKAGTRWWWLGSAVDKENLQWNLSEYARVGIGAVEITPLYGVQGNDENNISFLSPRWMQALKTVQDIAQPLGIEVDMNCGTGWPFGGPHISLDQAACKAIFKDTVINGVRTHDVEIGRTKQKVKRAAPGGEGWVVDHFDREAVHHYLDRFEQAFATSGVPYPHTFFNDSYEVYKANWTPSLFEEFQKRRGYDLRSKLPELLGEVEDSNQVLCDYRETLSDLLLENFTQQWVSWAHQHGVKVRNQAHGSPANLLDLYAAVDIPEIEGFGLSEFGIKGLRTDPGMTRKNFSDVSMLKYASSAAHVTGKPFTSSETFTWLTEHFRTSLSQMKPDLDLMFTCGVNHVYFHGACYTPKDDPWPGWKFYASIDMSPTNSIWRDAPYLMKYIERCQSFLQLGQPDNDFLVYLPVRDMWRIRGPRNDDAKEESKDRRGGEDLLMQFDIHTMDEKAPQFIKSILTIDSLGYDCDYISDRQLAKVRIEDGLLVTEGGTRYRALIIPSNTTIDSRLQTLLTPISDYIIQGESAEDMARFAKSEPMKTAFGLRAIRRKTTDGWHYFIANLTPNDIKGETTLAVPFTGATWFNPMNGDITPACVRDGKLCINLKSGESRILQTSSQQTASACEEQQPSEPIEIKGPWTLTFTEESPRVEDTFHLDTLQTWETLSDSAAITMGTGIYTTTFQLTGKQAKRHWHINLGDVRESARVYLNGQFLGCAWAVPYILDCHDATRKGRNELRIEVTNLPANRIADLDRRGVVWRKFNEINVVDINYHKTTYAQWAPVPSGLRSKITLQ